MRTVKNSFESYICKANSAGAGFISLPERLESKFQIGKQVKININGDKSISFYTKIRKWRGLGVYVPKKIATENNLCQKTCRVEIEQVNGFHTKIGSDGRIYIPKKRAEELQLEEGKIIKVKGEIGKTKETVYKPINIREKETTADYRITFDEEKAGKEGLFKIEDVLVPSSEKQEVNKDLREALEGLDWVITEEGIKIFDGKKVPVTLTKNLRLDSLSYYLGAFFADGTKRGDSWGIAASTFQQARFYKEKHQRLVKDSDLKTQLTYTSPPSNRIKKEKLIGKWEDEVSISVDSFREIKTDTKNARNRNKYGSLSIREHRILSKEIYNILLSLLIKRIIESEDNTIAWNFLLGVMEGDGAPGSKSRGHIVISTNHNEITVLKKVFKSLGLQSDGYRETEKRYVIRIGSLELISNLNLIADKLFHLYPKRRKRTINRLLETGASKFILNPKRDTSAWVKRYLRKEKILDKNNKLTTRGKETQKNLNNLKKEI